MIVITSNQPALPQSANPLKTYADCPTPLDKVIRPSAIKLPQTPFARFRLLFLVFAVASAVMAALAIPTGDAGPGAKLGGIGLSFALAAYWIFGYRRGRFSLALELFEVYAVFIILHVAPGDPFLPLLGILFRSLYGGFARAVCPVRPVDGRAARRARRPRRRAARGRPRPRRRRGARAGARPGAARGPEGLGDHPAPPELDRPELHRRRHHRRRRPQGALAGGVDPPRARPLPRFDRRHPRARTRPPGRPPRARRLLRRRRRQPRAPPLADPAPRSRRGRAPPLRRRRRQPPARPERRGLRAQHARRHRPPRARGRAACPRRPARARRFA